MFRKLALGAFALLCLSLSVHGQALFRLQNVVSGGGCVRIAAVCGSCSARANKAGGPGNMTKVTKMPTARKATSLTTDSVAIATINPS